MNNSAYSKKKITIALLGFIASILLVSLVSMYVINRSSNDDRERLDIQNIDDFTKGKPVDKDKLNRIQYDLFNTVGLNIDTPIKDRSIKDVYIRDDSFSQEYIEGNTLHRVAFIVDIESIKQSYRVSYEWVDDENNSQYLDEWGTVVQCLPEEDLIYGPFDCKDMFTEMEGFSDPLITNSLPYNSSFYSIRYHLGDSGVVLSIQIMSNNNSTRTKERFETYKKDAEKWLVENGIDLNSYTIQYRNFSNELVFTRDKTSQDKNTPS